MRITTLGHAGLHIETAHGTLLCDPWVNPAFFASWFPFPDNRQLDWAALGQVDYLFISHLHSDHFDPKHLALHVSRGATVLLPDYPTDELQHSLERLGFTNFVRLTNNRSMWLGGLSVMISSLVAPTDGAVGDAAISIDDGTARILNQNDAKITEFDPLRRYGPYDAHFVQFTGANWWPWVYDLSGSAKQSFGSAKRKNGLDRARRFAQTVGARYIVPSAGPACFLDDELFQYNDVDSSGSNTFPDQTVLLEQLAEHGLEGVFNVPGTVIEIVDGRCAVTQPGPDEVIRRPFDNKLDYLREYRESRMTELLEARVSWGRPGMDLYSELKQWIEPLLEKAEHIAAGIGGPVLLITDDERIVLDFRELQVRRYEGEKCRYSFTISRPLLETVVARREPDWVNSIFLSLRFSATRVGQYNEYIYAFFSCLSAERMEYANSWYGRPAYDGERIQLGRWTLPRRCPHRNADLQQLGEVVGDTLVCQMHGWRFDLRTGRCITSPKFSLDIQQVGDSVRTEHVT
jgi:UDP-MurNAc hydroxylase